MLIGNRGCLRCGATGWDTARGVVTTDGQARGFACASCKGTGGRKPTPADAAWRETMSTRVGMLEQVLSTMLKAAKGGETEN